MSERIEKDSMGELAIPAEAYWGVQTERARMNFQISGERPQIGFVWSMVQIKKACARANFKLGKLDEKRMKAIVSACDEVLAGKWLDQWVVDPWQAGAGTSHNMNTNEVLANRANEILGGKRGDNKPVSSNDTVNMSQSTNDCIPTAIRLLAIRGARQLGASLDQLAKAFEAKAEEFDGIVKSGRTHLQDAVPVRLGQEFGGYAHCLRRHQKWLEASEKACYPLGLGGSAAGTGLNTHEDYRDVVTAILAEQTGYPLVTSHNYFEAMQSLSPAVTVSNAVRNLALDLIRIANDLRLLASGPRTGFNEILLPAVQPGSSIMPGKVNPVLPENMNMVCYSVLGYDTTVAYCSQAGQLELNVMMPTVAYALEKEMTLLANATAGFAEKCIRGIEAHGDRCREFADKSLAVVTILNEHVGYLKAAEVAKLALAKDMSVREAAVQLGTVTKEQLDEIFDVTAMTEPKSAVKKPVGA
jgi:fumarate hydratase class II